MALSLPRRVCFQTLLLLFLLSLGIADLLNQGARAEGLKGLEYAKEYFESHIYHRVRGDQLIGITIGGKVLFFFVNNLQGTASYKRVL